MIVAIPGRLPALAALVLCSPQLAAAQESPGVFELTPYAGYRFGGTFEDQDGGTAVELDDHGDFGVILNIRESANTQWEVIYSRQDTSADLSELALADASIDTELHYFQAGGTYLGAGERARPYLAATIGGTHISPGVTTYDSDTFWSFSIGAGLQLRPSERIGVRLEARAWGTLVDSDTSLFCASGPEGGICAIAIDGRVLWQMEAFAGLVFRF
ncbi:MAG: porin family protein [Gammaproteobacteria bacterium]|nr:porin family protein [Gammaproteobacteria bacterium]